MDSDVQQIKDRINIDAVFYLLNIRVHWSIV